MKKSTHYKFAALVAVTVTVSALTPLLSGCGKSATSSPDIPPTSFRADPSKMTPADKAKMEQMMKGGGRPPAK